MATIDITEQLVSVSDPEVREHIQQYFITEEFEWEDAKELLSDLEEDNDLVLYLVDELHLSFSEAVTILSALVNPPQTPPAPQPSPVPAMGTTPPLAYPPTVPADALPPWASMIRELQRPRPRATKSKPAVVDAPNTVNTDEARKVRKFIDTIMPRLGKEGTVSFSFLLLKFPFAASRLLQDVMDRYQLRHTQGAQDLVAWMQIAAAGLALLFPKVRGDELVLSQGLAVVQDRLSNPTSLLAPSSVVVDPLAEVQQWVLAFWRARPSALSQGQACLLDLAIKFQDVVQLELEYDEDGRIVPLPDSPLGPPEQRLNVVGQVPKGGSIDDRARVLRAALETVDGGVVGKHVVLLVDRAADQAFDHVFVRTDQVETPKPGRPGSIELLLCQTGLRMVPKKPRATHHLCLKDFGAINANPRVMTVSAHLYGRHGPGLGVTRMYLFYLGGFMRLFEDDLAGEGFAARFFRQAQGLPDWAGLCERMDLRLWTLERDRDFLQLWRAFPMALKKQVDHCGGVEQWARRLGS